MDFLAPWWIPGKDIKSRDFLGVSFLKNSSGFSNEKLPGVILGVENVGFGKNKNSSTQRSPEQDC